MGPEEIEVEKVNKYKFPGPLTEYHHGTNQEAIQETQLKLHSTLECTLQLELLLKVKDVTISKLPANLLDHVLHVKFRTSFQLLLDQILTTERLKLSLPQFQNLFHNHTRLLLKEPLLNMRKKSTLTSKLTLPQNRKENPSKLNLR